MEHRYLAALAICGACAAFPACGDKSPTAPAAPTVTGLTVTVQAGGTIYIGSAAQLQATETLSDGTTRPAAATWSSDAPTVATVSPNGVVTGVGAGEATIAADVNATRGTLRIRVYPDFNGTWLGSEATVSCDDAGAFEGICNDPDFYTAGRLFRHDSRYTQTEAAVTALLGLGGDYTASGTATVSTTGELQLPSTRVLPEDGVVRMDIDDVRFRADVPSRMTGTYGVRITAPGYDGFMLLGVRLENVTRVSATSAAHRANSGDSVASASRLARIRRALR